MVSTKRSISSILFLGALSSVVAGESARLLGGVTAPEGMFPYIVHLFKNGNPYCGGTLIDYQWVVTAAHCVAERDGNKSGAGSFVAASASEFKVGFGTNSGSLVNSVDVDSITVNSAFDPVWYTSDIALIKLGSSNNILTKAKTITISNGNISAGQTVITAGWGQTTNDSPAQSSQLMYAGLVTADDGTCQKGASDWNGQNGRYVCTSYSTAPGIGTCFGDSGGPLLINTGGGYTLLGLVSFDVNTKDSSNTRCAQNGDVSYFTRISSYLSFISSTTGIPDSVLIGASSPWSHSNDNASSSTADNSTSSSSSGSNDSNSSKGSSNGSNSSASTSATASASASASASGSSKGSNKSSSGSGSSSGNSKSSANGKATDKSLSANDHATQTDGSDDSDGAQESGVSGDAAGTGSAAGAKHSAAANSQKNSASTVGAISALCKMSLAAAALAALF